MSVMNYRRLGHIRDEFPHLHPKRARGHHRTNSRRKTSREVKRYDQRQAAAEIRAGLTEHND